MKTKLFTILLSIASLTSLQAHANNLKDGNFGGKGLWKSSSDQGTYEISTTIVGDSIETSYTLPDGTQKHWNFEMVQEINGFFKVTAYGAEVGHGYCLENVELCHYEIEVGKMALEETLTYQNGILYRFGSKDEGSGRVVWQEALDKK